MKKKGVVPSFRGNYRWLSNFEKCNILYKGIAYLSSEAAYQANKTYNIRARTIFSNLGPREAKVLGSELKLRGDWEEVKLEIMEDICRIKFNLPQFKPKLIDTGEMELIEGNYWGDTFWGMCDGEGENHLGKIIMKIREEVKEGLKRNGKKTS